MKKLLFFIVFFTLSLLLAQHSIFAQTQTQETMTKQYNIQFPIAELGNCDSFSACKTYCDDQAHKDACISFAKTKGFYKEPVKAASSEVLQSAKSELGCDSETSCREFCDQQANYEKCRTFGKKYNLTKAQENPADQQILEKAKTTLGCDSQSSCKNFCEDPQNQQKCSDFAKQSDLAGGITRVGPGGCTSEQSCKTYCESNRDKCQEFSKQTLQPSSAASPVPSTNTNDKQPREDFCKENPEKCKTTTPSKTQNHEEFCKQNPDFCKPIQKATRSSEQLPKQVSPVPSQKFEKQNNTQQVEKRSLESTEQKREFIQQNQEYQQRFLKEKETVQTTGEKPAVLIQPSEKSIVKPAIDQAVEGAFIESSFWDQILNFFFIKR